MVDGRGLTAAYLRDTDSTIQTQMPRDKSTTKPLKRWFAGWDSSRSGSLMPLIISNACILSQKNLSKRTRHTCVTAMKPRLSCSAEVRIDPAPGIDVSTRNRTPILIYPNFVVCARENMHLKPPGCA